MVIGKVVGNIVSTVKSNYFNSLKLLLVRDFDIKSKKLGKTIHLAVDNVSAGVGDIVLLVNEGSSTRFVLKDKNNPADSIIVGIIDNYDLRED